MNVLFLFNFGVFFWPQLLFFCWESVCALSVALSDRSELLSLYSGETGRVVWQLIVPFYKVRISHVAACLWCDDPLTGVIQGLVLFHLCKLVWSGFWLGFSSVTASSGGGSGSCARVPRSCRHHDVLALSNPRFCSMPGPDAPVLNNAVSIRLKLLVSSGLRRAGW